jgi:predicted membrane-bound spermidine synthase
VSDDWENAVVSVRASFEPIEEATLLTVAVRHLRETLGDQIYDYHLYDFADSDTKYVARSYRHEFEKAHFVRKEVGQTMSALAPSDLVTPLFCRAVEFLRAHGKSRVEYLSVAAEDYVEIPG